MVWIWSLKYLKIILNVQLTTESNAPAFIEYEANLDIENQNVEIIDNEIPYNEYIEFQVNFVISHMENAARDYDFASVMRLMRRWIAGEEGSNPPWTLDLCDRWHGTPRGKYPLPALAEAKKEADPSV